MTLSPADVQQQLRAHGIEPSRALGQNFVADPNTVRRIARLAEVGPDDAVVEIGAGLGSLTLALAEAGAAVTAVELDRHVLPLLRENVAGTGVQVIEGDAMALDWNDVLSGHPAWVLVANLPYNIATPLVLDLLRAVPAIERMLVMVQLEVGERLAGRPRTKAYGIPSVLVANDAHAEVVGKVPPTVFVPQPKVDSALVRIDRRRDGPRVPDAHRARFELLVRTAFGQRRKMLRRSLAAVDADLPSTFEVAGVSPEARPEELDLDAWARLTSASFGDDPPSDDG